MSDWNVTQIEHIAETLFRGLHLKPEQEFVLEPYTNLRFRITKRFEVEQRDNNKSGEWETSILTLADILNGVNNIRIPDKDFVNLKDGDTAYLVFTYDSCSQPTMITVKVTSITYSTVFVVTESGATWSFDVEPRRLFGDYCYTVHSDHGGVSRLYSLYDAAALQYRREGLKYRIRNRLNLLEHLDIPQLEAVISCITDVKENANEN